MQLGVTVQTKLKTVFTMRKYVILIAGLKAQTQSDLYSLLDSSGSVYGSSLNKLLTATQTFNMIYYFQVLEAMG